MNIWVLEGQKKIWSKKGIPILIEMHRAKINENTKYMQRYIQVNKMIGAILWFSLCVCVCVYCYY